jgi:hypothetical protein
MQEFWKYTDSYSIVPTHSLLTLDFTFVFVIDSFGNTRKVNSVNRFVVVAWFSLDEESTIIFQIAFTM